MKISTLKLGGRGRQSNGEIFEKFAEIFAIDNLSNSDWRARNVEYFQNLAGNFAEIFAIDNFFF